MALTYSLTVAFFVFLQALGGSGNPVTSNLLGIPMVFPILSIWFVRKVWQRESLWTMLGFHRSVHQWIFVSIAIPIAMAGLVDAYSVLFRHQALFTTRGVIAVMVIGISLSSVSALLEEVAWPGVAISLNS